MNELGCFVLILTIVMPIAWFASEFQDRRWLRLMLGTAAVLLSFGVAFLVGSLQRLNYNAWYGGATKGLIDTTISQLEAGHMDRVLLSLKDLQSKYEPTYENRAHYDTLVTATVEDMKSAK